LSWRQQFFKMHPDLMNFKPNFSKFRFILGIGRSGTSWINRVFARSIEDLRCFSEPLYRVKPHIQFCKSYDHLTLGYTANISSKHPLAILYTALLAPKANWDVLGLITRKNAAGVEYKQPRIISDPYPWSNCLVKETHSLLATEALLNYFQAPTVFTLRNPIYLIDSIIDAFKLKGIYLINEYNWLVKNYQLDFLTKSNIETLLYVASKPFKTYKATVISQKFITSLIIQDMFRNLAKRYPSITLTVNYEDNCNQPFKVFKKIAAFFKLKWTNKCDKVLRYCTTNEKSNLFTTCKISKNQPKRNFKWLSPEDVELCKELLNRYIG